MLRVRIAIGGSFRPAVEERLAERRAEIAFEEVLTGVELTLAPPVPGGQGQEHGTALPGRWYAVVRQQVLDSQLGPRSVQLRGDRSGGGPHVLGQ